MPGNKLFDQSVRNHSDLQVDIARLARTLVILLAGFDRKLAALLRGQYRSTVRVASTEHLALRKNIQSLRKEMLADGVLVTQVIDVDGEQRFGATGLPMTVRELVVTMKQDPDYASLFSSDVSRGSGPPPKRTAGKPQGQSKNAVSKIAAGLDALR